MGGHEEAGGVGLAAGVVFAAEVEWEAVGDAHDLDGLGDVFACGAGDDDAGGRAGECAQERDGGRDADVGVGADLEVNLAGEDRQVVMVCLDVRPTVEDGVADGGPCASEYPGVDGGVVHLLALVEEPLVDGGRPQGFGFNQGAVEVEEVGGDHNFILFF